MPRSLKATLCRRTRRSANGTDELWQNVSGRRQAEKVRRQIEEARAKGLLNLSQPAYRRACHRPTISWYPNLRQARLLRARVRRSKGSAPAQDSTWTLHSCKELELN